VAIPPKLRYALVALSLLALTCSGRRDYPDLDFKQEMRDLVKAISGYAGAENPGFIIVPQNGQELNTLDGDNRGQPDTEYLSAIDAVGQEDLFYGFEEDDGPTPARDNEYLTDFCDIAKAAGLIVLVTDYCFTPSRMDDSYTKNEQRGYISFAADSRELDTIPDYPARPYNESSSTVESPEEIRNFLYLINPDRFSSKEEFIAAVRATNYDLLIMDYFFDEDTFFSSAEVEKLRLKANGGRRLVISYMSIGEAEEYRYYWDEKWYSDPPTWLDEENPDWEGNYKVRYWMEEWQDILFGDEDAYLDRILSAGFDGVYLDIIDAFEYYE
jgi:cysteinyl-tRNA synthetase